NGGKNSLNRLIRCVCGKKIGPDPRNFNQRVSLGRNDLLIRTFLSSIFLSTGIGHMYQSMGFTSSYIVLGGIALCFTLISFITLDKARVFSSQPVPAN
ncbi:MFS transporter, partial [Klebsiella pneumoniae]|uniref:MFS transporter n=2 Tax=Klebsiella pneumoniae TaxID=573 RepID=UPI002405BCAF